MTYEQAFEIIKKKEELLDIVKENTSYNLFKDIEKKLLSLLSLLGEYAKQEGMDEAERLGGVTDGQV